MGITDDVRKLADHSFFIPMKGFAESFNVSAASAITCTYLDLKGALNPTTMTESMKKRLKLTYLCRSVKASIPILRREGINVESERLYNNIAKHTTKP